MNKLLQWFTGPIDGIVERHQARTVVIFLWVIIITCILLWPFSQQYGSEFPFIPTIFVSLILLFFYKATRSNFLIGNLCAFSIFMATVNLSFKSGGIYSLDIAGLILVPIIAINMVGWRSSLGWTLASTLPIFYHFKKSKNTDILQTYREQLFGFELEYFLMLHLVVIILPMILVFIFIKLNRSLVKEIENRNSDLDEANEILASQTIQLTTTKNELEKSNTLLKKYAHVTSHDLKQPIRTISSFSQLLNREIEKKEPNKESIQTYLKLISEGSTRMNTQVEEILSYSKNIDKNSVQNIDVKVTIDEVIADLAHQINENQIQLRLSNLPTIQGIPATVYTLFQNLISNAIKYKHPARDLTLDIEAQEKDCTWTFSIKDNGIGIPKDKLGLIFKMGTQIDSNKEGFGIGLNTVKEFIETTGGKIWVQSQEGIGSTFSFTYPKFPKNAF